MHIQTSLPPGFESGAFTCAEALAAGISAKRLRSRDVDHPFWGICVAAGSVQNLQDRCRAFQQRMPAGAFSAMPLLPACTGYLCQQDSKLTCVST
ncbi:hypothetical protein [Cryobacterium sp. Y29]|uniref:hypothetical protein n=1 Tax=Cryobacterium sp. Y29 TaxID=2048285 RepID=UPI0011B07494|nr:hypothetical protein [Cryobacterium sp. Y29]